MIFPQAPLIHFNCYHGNKYAFRISSVGNILNVALSVLATRYTGGNVRLVAMNWNTPLFWSVENLLIVNFTFKQQKTPKDQVLYFGCFVFLRFLLVAKPDYTRSVHNIMNTFLILSWSPVFPQYSLIHSLEYGLYKVSKAFHRDAGPCWPQRFPQLCQVVWMSFWVVDHSWYTRETVECEKPSSVAVLDTNWCSWHLLPYPI